MFFTILRQQRDIFAMPHAWHLVPFERLLWKPIVVLREGLRGLVASKICPTVTQLNQTQVEHCDEGTKGYRHHVLQREGKVGKFLWSLSGEYNMQKVKLVGAAYELSQV